MQTALESLEKEELIALVKQREQENAYLKSQIEMYRRMQFGQKRERFEGDPAQIALPFEALPSRLLSKKKSCKKKSTISVKGLIIRAVRRCPLIYLSKNRVAGRSRFTPLVIFLKWYVSARKLPKIGPPTRLDYEPARFLIKRYIRYKYAPKNGDGVRIGQLPERVIDKGIPSAGLLASILTDKYQDHLPLYRQNRIAEATTFCPGQHPNCFINH